MIPPTAKQATVLRSLALKGPGNIQQIQLREGMNYPSTHRSVKYLEGRGLVWMSDIGDRGPKSPQTFSLTPFGVLYSIIFCSLWSDTRHIAGLWGEVTPLFIRYRERFEELGLGSEFTGAAIKVYDDLVLLQRMINLYSEKENLLEVYRNSLDQYFLSIVCTDHNAAKLSHIAEIIRADTSYLAIWKRFYSIEKLKMDFLETLNSEINAP